MPNAPKAAAQKRAALDTPRSQAQSDHEGSAHHPEEFAVMNPAPGADPDATPEQQRVAPDDLRRHALAQGTDKPAIPGGRNPDSAMCEDRARPGQIDKSNDC